MSLAWSDSRVPVPPLRQVAALDVRCDSCGRIGRIDDDKLIELSQAGFEHMHQLEGKLVCKSCAERHKLALMPYYRKAA